MSEQHTENKYFKNDNDQELYRLDVQQDLLFDFDKPTYRSVVEGLDNQALLDIGCNNGTAIMKRIGNRNEIKYFCGIESDADAVNDGNEKYGSENFQFFACDCEDTPTLTKTIRNFMQTHSIDGFDIVNISMLLLHLKDPEKLLLTVHNFMAPGGVIVIRDIDDGLNLAYPDKDGTFDQIFDIVNGLETSGYRHQGREIYGMLKRCGYKDILIDKQSLSTVEKSFSERIGLFNTYFMFVKEDMAIMLDRHKDDKKVQDDNKWFNDVLPNIEQAFYEDDFFFQIGFMIFTAEA